MKGDCAKSAPFTTINASTVDGDNFGQQTRKHSNNGNKNELILN